MPKGYKLTAQDFTTHNGVKWGENVTHYTGYSKVLTRRNLCSATVIHLYDSPALAALLNVIHGAFHSPVLWECEYEEPSITDGTKRGTTKLTTIKRLPLPEVSIKQYTDFALACADYAVRIVAGISIAKIVDADTARAAANAADAAYNAAADAADAAYNAVDAAYNAADNAADTAAYNTAYAAVYAAANDTAYAAASAAYNTANAVANAAAAASAAYNTAAYNAAAYNTAYAAANAAAAASAAYNTAAANAAANTANAAVYDPSFIYWIAEMSIREP